MIRKKAKRAKTAGKKPAKRKAAAKKEKETHPEDVRKEVSLMVESEATEMAQAVIDRGKMGELATVKYLFEMSGVFPPSSETKEGTPEEDSLAETLLHRLNIPIEPVKFEEEDEPIELGEPGKSDEEREDADGSSASAVKNDEGEGEELVEPKS